MTSTEFNQKINNMSNILHSFAYSLTKNTEDAKDLFQETAFRAITNQEKFKAGTNLKAWLFTIMKNIFINNYRKKVKANTIMDATDNQYFLNSGKQTIRNDGESTVMMEELLSMVNQLENGLRIPFMMHYKGFKYQEIANEMKLPLGTIKSRIFFARKELKAMINIRYQGMARQM